MTDVSFAVFVALFQSAPGILTLGGILFAANVAGPPGFIGALLEVVGVNMLFDPGRDGGIGFVLVGALIVAVFSLVPWARFYRELLSGGRF